MTALWVYTEREKYILGKHFAILIHFVHLILLYV